MNVNTSLQLGVLIILKLPTKVLVVDSDVTGYNQLVGQLQKYAINTMWARDLDTAIYLHGSHNFDAAVIQKDFDNVQGLSIAQKFRRKESLGKQVTGILISSGRNLDRFEKSLFNELGDLEVISKPYQAVKVIPALHRTTLRAEKNESLIQSYHDAIKALLKDNVPVKEAERYITKHLGESKSKAVSALISFYIETKNYDRGLTVVNTLLEKRPNDISILNAKAKLLLILKRNDEALKVMERCDEVAPKNIERLESMVDVYLKVNQPEKSVQKMKELTELNPEIPDFKFTMYNKLFEYGYDDCCREFCRDTSHPLDVLKFYNNRGVVQSRKGDHEAALKSYEYALKLNPSYTGNYRIHFNIALALLKSRSKDSQERALIHINECLKINPTFNKARVLFNRFSK